MKPQVRVMKHRLPFAELLVAGLLLLVAGARLDGPQTSVTLADESRLWIEGTSSVNTFTCAAGTVEGEAVLTARQPAGARPVDDRPVAAAEAEAEVQVPVRRFDCGKSRMNNDLYAALKAEQYDLIRFRLDEADLVTPATHAGIYHLRIIGQLHIAGTERTVTMDVEGQQNPNGTYRATGSLPLRMSDFGIDPPTALFGLIKAHDRITVHFDLIATT